MLGSSASKRLSTFASSVSTAHCEPVAASQLGEQAAVDRSSNSSPTPAATRVRGKLIAQDRGDVLALAQQPDHPDVVSAFEVAPEQRELCDPPSPKPWNAKELSERR